MIFAVPAFRTVALKSVKLVLSVFPLLLVVNSITSVPSVTSQVSVPSLLVSLPSLKVVTLPGSPYTTVFAVLAIVPSRIEMVPISCFICTLTVTESPLQFAVLASSTLNVYSWLPEGTPASSQHCYPGW